MQRSSLFCAGWWPFLVLPLLLLLLVLFFKWHPIEEDVAKNATEKLAGHEWAKVETFNRGREVLITGTPPDEQSIQQAYELAKSAYGVRSVEISSTVKVPNAPPSEPQIDAIMTGNSIVLNGVLDSQASINALVSQANVSFGRNNVVNNLSIGDNTAALPNLSGFFNGLVGKTEGQSSLTASLKKGMLTLTGEVENSGIKTAVGDQMRRLFGSAVDNRLTITAPPPPPEPTITEKRVDCLNQVNQLLSEGKINFASGKAVINQSSYQLLNDIATATKSCPGATFEVAGHTDSVGSLALNMNLSEKRAQAVVEHLVNLGLDLKQFSSAGYGPNQPVADNETAEGRAQNRRIEFKLKN